VAEIFADKAKELEEEERRMWEIEESRKGEGEEKGTPEL
jgi:hypothetical protein